MLSEESLSDIWEQSMAALSQRHRKKSIQTKIIHAPLLGRAQSLTEIEAHKIIGREVEAIVVRMEPLDRLLDPIVQAALIGHHPAIASFLPMTEESIFNNYVPTLDKKCKDSLTAVFKIVGGLMNIAFDGATFLSKSKVSFQPM